jgi:hypothetical protein
VCEQPHLLLPEDRPSVKAPAGLSISPLGASELLQEHRYVLCFHRETNLTKRLFCEAQVEKRRVSREDLAWGLSHRY